MIPTQTASLLLDELALLDVRLRPEGEHLRVDAPRDALTPDLLDRLRQHKPALLTLLREPQPLQPTPAVTYTDHEHRLLSRAPASLQSIVGLVKSVFSDTGGVTVVGVHPEPDHPRLRAAAAIRDARRQGAKARARALRDAWEERMAITIVDGGLSEERAEAVAVEEITCASPNGKLGYNRRHGRHHGSSAASDPVGRENSLRAVEGNGYLADPPVAGHGGDQDLERGGDRKVSRGTGPRNRCPAP